MDDFNEMNNGMNGADTSNGEQSLSGTVENTPLNPDPNQFGQPPQFGQSPYQFDNNGGAPQQGKGMAIASMVCGIVSIVIGCCCCTPVGIICGIIGVVLGILVKKQNRAGGEMALAGIICGAIGFVVSLVTLIINIVNTSNGNNPWQEILDQMSSAAQFIIK